MVVEIMMNHLQSEAISIKCSEVTDTDLVQVLAEAVEIKEDFVEDLELVDLETTAAGEDLIVAAGVDLIAAEAVAVEVDALSAEKMVISLENVLMEAGVDSGVVADFVVDLEVVDLETPPAMDFEDVEDIKNTIYIFVLNCTVSLILSISVDLKKYV